MTSFTELLTTIKEVRAATLIHVAAERDPEIRAGMEINLDLLTRALDNAGWPYNDEGFISLEGRLQST